MFFDQKTRQLFVFEGRSFKSTTDLLIQIKKSRKPMIEMNRLTTEQKNDIKALVLHLGNNILTKEALQKNKLSSVAENKQKFSKMVDSLSTQPHFVSMTTYAYNLLQFYVFLTNNRVSEFHTGFDVMIFLNSHRDMIGNTDDNPFVQEYLIITIYNHLAMSQKNNSFSSENIVNYFSIAQALAGTLDAKVEQQPYNGFALYLKCLINLVNTKLHEMFFMLHQHEYSQEKKSDLLTQQQSHLHQARQCVEDIKEMTNELTARGSQFLLGQEYNYGQALFNRLPEGMDLEQLHEVLSTPPMT